MPYSAPRASNQVLNPRLLIHSEEYSSELNVDAGMIQVFSGCILADAEMPVKPFIVAMRAPLTPGMNIEDIHDGIVEDGMIERRLKVEHMPPLVLRYRLPQLYPSREPPIYTLSSSWLTEPQVESACFNFEINHTMTELYKLEQLCARLDEIWEEQTGYAVLFRWCCNCAPARYDPP